jgi:solute carrier family 25 carnitine/acylcarnitine transporter 20/29
MLLLVKCFCSRKCISFIAIFLAVNISCNRISSSNNFATVHAFSSEICRPTKRISSIHSATSLSVIGTGAASLLAGSVGGAIGVGVAYPLDTLKTKAQVFSQRRAQQKGLKQNESIQQQQQQQLFVTQESTNGTVLQTTESGVVCLADDCYKIESPEDDLVSLVKLILEEEGIAGFFGGVKAMMIGQALIKSVAFSANELAFNELKDINWDTVGLGNVVGTVPEQNALISSSFLALILAASFSGFVTSFLVTPVERVKVMMQAQSTNALYANELECIQAVLKNEGFVGLFSRGLGTTLAREVPSYAIYFVVYGLLIHTSVAENYLGGAAPLLCGAIR